MSTDTPKPTPGRGAPPQKPRRVYKNVSVAEERGLFCVFLDGKPAHTPARKRLGTPIRTLADVLAAEWDAQDPVIDRETMPITRLVSAALDRIGPERGAVINGLIAFIDSDLLCYRAEYPAALKARQNGVWQPVLDWLRDEHRIQFAVVEGVIPTPQSAETALALRTKIESFDDEALTAFQACAAATKSLALSMALVHGHLSAAEVAASAHLDEFYQMDQWGEDREALIRLRVIKSEIHAIGRYLGHLARAEQRP